MFSQLQRHSKEGAIRAFCQLYGEKTGGKKSIASIYLRSEVFIGLDKVYEWNMGKCFLWEFFGNILVNVLVNVLKLRIFNHCIKLLEAIGWR